MIQATVLLFQYKLNKAYPGLGWWAAGSLAGAVGFALNALREQEAFRRIQQYSMAKRKSIREVAEAIIDASKKKTR